MLMVRWRMVVMTMMMLMCRMCMLQEDGALLRTTVTAATRGSVKWGRPLTNTLPNTEPPTILPHHSPLCHLLPHIMHGPAWSSNPNPQISDGGLKRMTNWKRSDLALINFLQVSMNSYPCLNFELFIPSAYLKLRISSRMSKVAHNELRISLKIFWTLILRSDMSDVVTKVKIWRVEKREGEYKRSLGGWDENVKAATPMKGPWFSVHVTASSETAYNFYIEILLYFTNHSKSPILIQRSNQFWNSMQLFCCYIFIWQTTTCSWFQVVLNCAKYSTFN